MKRLIIKILFRLIGIKIPINSIDGEEMNRWLGLQYPVPAFRNYIKTRSFSLLQVLGDEVPMGKEYYKILGQRIELNRLLFESKTQFNILESKKPKNEKPKNE